MALLEMALVYVLANEGGVSRNTSDRGGLTNMGVTQKTLSSYLGRPATDAEVTNLDKATATDLYRKMYWNVIRGDSIKSQAVATAFFDMAVLMGPQRATVIAQKVAGVSTDGVMGPMTLAAINALAPCEFLSGYQAGAGSFFKAIIAADASQSVFATGWSYRATKMTSAALV